MSSQQPTGTPAASPPPATTTTTKSTNKRKKTTKSAGGGSSSANRAALSAQSVLSAASRATRELSDLRTQTESRRNDIAWLSNDVSAIASSSFDTNNNGMNESKIVDMALRNNGIYVNVTNNNDIGVTPRGYTVLLEYAKKYACELYTDAQDYTWHANRKEVQPIDLKLASELRSSTSPTDTNTQSIMEALAEDCNSIPLPPIPNNCYHGVVLPPKDYQLTSRTFDVIVSSSSASEQQSQEDIIPKPEESSNNISSRKNSNPSYGANKGKQIKINLKSNTTSSTATSTTIAPETTTSSNNTNTPTTSDVLSSTTPVTVTSSSSSSQPPPQPMQIDSTTT